MKKEDEEHVLVGHTHCMGLYVTEWMKGLKEGLNRGTEMHPLVAGATEI